MAVIDQERAARIRQILKWNPRGMTISDLTKKMQINRNLVAKNLDLLVIAGQVEMQPVGAAKVYFLSQRVPVSSMLEFSSDLVIMIDKEEKIIFVNELVMTLLDTKREFLLGKRIGTLSHPFLRDLLPNVPVQGFLGGPGEESVAEMSCIIKNEHRYFRTKAIPTAFEDGSQGSTYIIEDITARKRYQQMLEISEARYRGIVRSSGEAIIGSTPDGRIASWNPAAEKLFGYPESAIREQPFRTLVSPHRAARLDQLLRDIGHGNCVQGCEMRMIRSDGTTIDVLITICPIRDEDGTITGASSIIRDITHEKLGMHAREFEDRYRTLVEDLNVGVYRSTGDPRGRFVWGNTVLLRILGFGTMEDLKGVDVTTIFSFPEGRQEHLGELQKRGFVKNRIISLKRTDGTPITVSVTALAEFDDNKNLVFINGIVQDITGFIHQGEKTPGQPAEPKKT